MGLSQDRRRDKIEDGSMPALEGEQKRWDGGKGEGELLLSGPHHYRSSQNTHTWVT